jgi:tRNA(Ile)-lysidine synthase
VPAADVVSVIHARARDAGLLAEGRAVVVMLSGGRDSSCLLEVAVAVCGAAAVSAVHVNYGLRDAAAEDERHCLAHCERLSVPLAVHRPARPPGGNLQAWAREERYSAARARAAERGAEIATGHTADDQIETILYRLASSPSRRALLGMEPRDAGVVRPLLCTTRQETTAYCRARGIQWREDESNAGDRFARGRIRHELIPALRRVHPAAEANVLALADILRGEAAVLDAAVNDALAGGSEVPLAELRALPPALARLIVQRLADAAIGRPAPGVARRAQELMALGDHATLDLPHGVRAVVRRGILRMSPQT